LLIVTLACANIGRAILSFVLTVFGEGAANVDVIETGSTERYAASG
jgi:hypothetical protein